MQRRGSNERKTTEKNAGPITESNGDVNVNN